MRPDRSDAHLTAEEEARVEGEARESFEGIVPKRHTKPQRSEYSTVYADALQPSDGAEDPIPELAKFQDLEAADPQKLVYNGSEPAAEYVETEYYKDLNCIDKQHHTTGTGFIKFESKTADVPHLVPDSDVFEHHESCKGNPATNEWIPTAEMVNDKSMLDKGSLYEISCSCLVVGILNLVQVISVSSKPKRSDN
ncbi:hypothetical protein QJS04_geneDACA007606 [Acorus gramineus]|uniref:Uncharacterized protein n=1 Tax=Acorus gramineus TaxID=55184 RepID=A0AAV9B5M8_ACOGR|nr:hypothetical protein QJS04_geneDACA007606 [Acorus gramineus]